MLKQAKKQILAGGVALTIASGLALAPASAQTMYKWVDEQGNVTYQDQPPPDSAKKVDAYAAPSDEGGGSQSGGPVTLYSVPKCDACDLVRFLLQKNSVPFTERNPNEDRVAADELKKKTGQISVPSLSIGDKLIMGYSSIVIRDELRNAGYALQDETSSQAAEQPASGPNENTQTEAPGQNTAAEGAEQPPQAENGSPTPSTGENTQEQAAQ